MIVFVIAMQSEAEPVIRNFKNVEIEEKRGRKIYRGELNEEKCAAMVCGVGKVNAAAGTQFAIDCLSGDKIINIGTAGGLNADLVTGRIYAVSEAVQYDFDLAQLNGTPIGTLNEYEQPYIKVCTCGAFPKKRLATGDRFNDSSADYTLIAKELGAEMRDMEFGAIAHVCAHCGVKCYSFKAISDIAGSGSTTEQFKTNLAKCAEAIYKNTRQIFADVLKD